jgi:putative ABC transport system permease protein
MSWAYAQESDQIPNELAYIGLTELMRSLQEEYPDMIWTPRIRFGGLLDIPDSLGMTKAQGPVVGLAVDLLTPASPERTILNLENAIIRGRLPVSNGEIIISEDFAEKLQVKLGDTATLITTTMYGSFTTANFSIVGTIQFGIAAMDRGAMIAHIADVQYALDMENATGEILGFYNDYLYRDDDVGVIAASFNKKFHTDDEYSPFMVTLREQSGLSQILDYVSVFTGVINGIFIIIMSIVLWNAGLMGSLRRYGEIGVRLAIGEHKGHVYRSLIIESLMLGFFGSVFGTVIGLAISYYLQVKGIDISSMMKNASILIESVIRAQVTPVSYIIGFIPGLLATLLGTSISGIGIYRRQTSQLFKELEA